MKNTFTILLFLLLLCACHDSKRTGDYPILKVSLEKEKVSIKDLFDRFEVIPLETNDSSLLIWPDKILCWNGRYEIFDSKCPALFVFDEAGKFLEKIGKKGDGPEEYTEIYDVIQDKETGEIYMLSPFGEIFIYDFNGTFIKRIKLPQKINYQSFENFDDCFVTWTLPAEENEDGISLILKDSLQCIKSYWHGNRNLYFLYPRAFYKYGEEVLFFRPFGREVYQIDKNNMSVAYKWDFGKDNYSMSDWDISENKSGGEKESASLMQKLKDSTIPYIISHQAQTDRLYYSQLILGFAPTPKAQYHIFYNKTNGQSLFFNETLEGIYLNPFFWGEEFVLCLASNEDLSSYMKVLEKTEINKIMNRREDDNPVLIKCYYK